jgi:hypothetical protein
MEYFSLFFFYFVKYKLLKDIRNGLLIFSDAYIGPVQPWSYKLICFLYDSHFREIRYGLSFLEVGLIDTNRN